ncbi:jg12109 [Pararge aegeria aegeria]|uniref:Jg12109 protein n=1 Tax=Pararge aegeria aegeria TaxID=348720 RepID=A0A8S4S5R9_9NEOP|nr:jg12109 [Pararge aegeria aegeria]
MNKEILNLKFEFDDTPTYLMLEYMGVVEQRERDLHPPTPTPSNNLGGNRGMLGFWNENGWSSKETRDISTHNKRQAYVRILPTGR